MVPRASPSSGIEQVTHTLLNDFNDHNSRLNCGRKLMCVYAHKNAYEYPNIRIYTYYASHKFNQKIYITFNLLLHAVAINSVKAASC